jgi:radical SAM protein with 4Fe4S-binding SPASM domain
LGNDLSLFRIPCRRLPIRAGNLLDTPLEVLYQCDLFRALRDRTQVCQGCEGCLYAHLCGGGLHCLAYAVTGSIFHADPGCWQARKSEVEDVIKGGRYV